MSVYERIAVDAPPDHAVVDHGHDMAAAGAPGFVAWTLVFGNPAAGAKLLERAGVGGDPHALDVSVASLAARLGEPRFVHRRSVELA